MKQRIWPCWLPLSVSVVVLWTGLWGMPVRAYIALPLHFHEQLPYLEVTIDQRRLRVLLDTGAAGFGIALPAAVAATLPSVHYGSALTRSVDASGRVRLQRQFLVANLQIGAWQIQQVSGRDYSPWGLEANANRSAVAEQVGQGEGVLGLAVFYDRRLLLDYPQQRLLVFAAAEAPDSRFADLQPLLLDRNGLSVEVNLHGYPQMMVLDTGANFSFERRHVIPVQQLGKPCELQLNVPGPCQVLELHSLRMGSKQLPGLTLYQIDFVGLETSGALGYNFLVNKEVWLDLRSRLVGVIWDGEKTRMKDS